MKAMMLRCMTWMLIGAAALLLFGLAQAPELWADVGDGPGLRLSAATGQK